MSKEATAVGDANSADRVDERESANRGDGFDNAEYQVPHVNRGRADRIYNDFADAQIHTGAINISSIAISRESLLQQANFSPEQFRQEAPQRKADFVVESSGDARSNTARLQEAINAAVRKGGGIVEVRPGVFSGQIEIPRNAQNLTIQGVIEGNRRPVFDQSGAQEESAFFVSSGRAIKIDGFEIKNGTRGDPPAGVKVSGSVRDLTLSNLHIHHMGTPTRGSQPIIILGTGSDQSSAITGLTIRDCHIHDSRLGQHENIAVNGNVDGFLIEHCTVEDVDNIGIDVIGGERTSRNPATDRARNGVIRYNLVRNINTDNNPTYERGSQSAGGIYVDGASDITIANNKVVNTNRGIEIGAEHSGVVARNVVVTDNILQGNHHAAITLGAGNRGGGHTVATRIVNNRYESNGTRSGKAGIDVQSNVGAYSDQNNGNVQPNMRANPGVRPHYSQAQVARVDAPPRQVSSDPVPIVRLPSAPPTENYPKPLIVLPPGMRIQDLDKDAQGRPLPTIPAIVDTQTNVPPVSGDPVRRIMPNNNPVIDVPRANNGPSPETLPATRGPVPEVPWPTKDQALKPKAAPDAVRVPETRLPVIPQEQPAPKQPAAPKRPEGRDAWPRLDDKGMFDPRYPIQFPKQTREYERPENQQHLEQPVTREKRQSADTVQLQELNSKQLDAATAARGEGPYHSVHRLLGSSFTHEEKLAVAMAVKEHYREEVLQQHSQLDPNMRDLRVGHKLITNENVGAIIGKVQASNAQLAARVVETLAKGEVHQSLAIERSQTGKRSQSGEGERSRNRRGSGDEPAESAPRARNKPSDVREQAPGQPPLATPKDGRTPNFDSTNPYVEGQPSPYRPGEPLQSVAYGRPGETVASDIPDPNKFMKDVVAAGKQQALDMQTVGDCAGGVRKALNRMKIGFQIEGPMTDDKGQYSRFRTGVELGEYLKSTGLFDAVPLSQMKGKLEPGMIAVRHWNKSVIAGDPEKLDRGDIAIIAPNGQQYNDHIQGFPWDGGRYVNSYVLIPKNYVRKFP